MPPAFLGAFSNIRLRVSFAAFTTTRMIRVSAMDLKQRMNQSDLSFPRPVTDCDFCSWVYFRLLRGPPTDVLASHYCFQTFWGEEDFLFSVFVSSVLTSVPCVLVIFCQSLVVVPTTAHNMYWVLRLLTLLLCRFGGCVVCTWAFSSICMRFANVLLF